METEMAIKKTYGPLLYHVGRSGSFRVEEFFALPTHDREEVGSWYNEYYIELNHSRVGYYLSVDNRTFEVISVGPFVSVGDFARRVKCPSRTSWRVNFESKVSLDTLFKAVFSGRHFLEEWRL
jgi:hypothetical protein